MLCYKDMTFCSSRSCINTVCPKFFGDTERDKADTWWGEGLGQAPVSFTNYSVDCPQYKSFDIQKRK